MSERTTPGRWTEQFLRPALIAGMMACLTAPAIVLVQELLPGWEGRYLGVFAFIASLEGILTERALARQRITGWAYLASRSAEALVLLLLLKLASYLPRGTAVLLADAQSWFSDPGSFVTSLDLLTSLAFLILWAGSLAVARLTMALDTEQAGAEPPEDKTSPEYYLWLTQPSITRERRENLEALTELLMWGGIFMLVLAAVVHQVLTSASGLVLPTLLYFVLGIALLSEARLSVNHAGWQSQGIPIQRGIARRWLLWVALFLVSVALLALILPTYYSVGPFRAFLGVVSMVYLIFQYIAAFLIFLLTLLLALIVPGIERGTPPTLSLRPPESAPVQEATRAAPAWLDTALSAVFWAILAAILVYAVYRVWQDRRAMLKGGQGTEGTWWRRLVAWLRALWRSWLGWSQATQERLRQQRALRQAEPRLPSRLARFFFPGRLPPRELIRYFYLSSERRAATAGKPRSQGQTPYEYREALDEHFPDLEPDLEGLTEAFILARYTEKPVGSSEAEAVKPLWERIRAALRRRAAGS